MCMFTFAFMVIWSEGVGTAEDRLVRRVVQSLLGMLSDTFVLRHGENKEEMKKEGRTSRRSQTLPKHDTSVSPQLTS